MFDKKAAQNLEGVRRAKDRRDQRTSHDQRAFDPRRAPSRQDQAKQRIPGAKPTTFKPTADASKGKWVRPVQERECGQRKWKNFEVNRGSSMEYRKEFQTSKKSAYISENYKGKNPMSRSQWRREQRRRKAEREAGAKDKAESSTNVSVGRNEKEGKPVEGRPIEKMSVGRKLFATQ